MSNLPQVKRSELQVAGYRKYGIGNMRLVSWRYAAPPITSARVPSSSRQRCVGRCSSADIVESEAGLWFSVSAFQTAAGLQSSLIVASLRRWVRLITTAAHRWRCRDGLQQGRRVRGSEMRTLQNKSRIMGFMCLGHYIYPHLTHRYAHFYIAHYIYMLIPILPMAFVFSTRSSKTFYL